VVAAAAPGEVVLAGGVRVVDGRLLVVVALEAALVREARSMVTV